MKTNKFSEKYIQQCINEFYGISSGSKEMRKANLLEAALFAEDVFCIVLTDQEICPENLGNPEAFIRFVQRKCGAY